MSKTSSIKSPDALELKPKPRISARVGKLAGIVVLLLLGLAGAVIAINIATHKGAGLGKRSRDANKNLAAALSIPEELFAKMPEKGVIPLSVSQPPALDTKNPKPEPLPLPNPQPAPTLTAQQPAQPNPIQQEREASLQKALAAATALDGFPSHITSNRADAQHSPEDSNPAPLERRVKEDNGNLRGLSPQGLAALRDEPDQNRQEQKLAFLEKASKQTETPYLPSTRKAPLSPLEIKTGTIIPATMVDGINSDLPGDLIAQVSENVYDTATGQHLLIPQGTKAYGTYDSQVAYAQTRLLVVWKRLIFPDASTLELAGMPGADRGGYAGFHDKVDNHYLRLIAGATLTSLLTAGFQLSQPANTNTNNGPTATQIGAAAVGQQFSQLGLELSRRNLAIQPTIIVRPGYQFVIKVNRDVIFPSVYYLPSISNRQCRPKRHRPSTSVNAVHVADFTKETL